MGGPTGVKRVKSGCVTCRIRRVKCDEEKPECRRCLSTGRKCDGYSTLPFSRRDLQAASQSASNQLMPSGCDTQNGLLPRLITDPAFGDLLEKRYFQFFRQRTVTSTNSLVDSRFWDRVVLQACHIEPAVKHAVLALSSLHQLSGLPHDSDTAHQHRLYAERQHHKALTSARALISSSSPQDVDRILVACVIFIVFEGVRGDYRAATMHMDSGRAIIAQNSARLRHASRRKDLVEIEHALARVDLPAICFSDRTSPYAYNLSDFYDTNPDLTPENFQDVNEAQASFINLERWLLLIGNHIDEEERNKNLVGMARYQAVKMKCAAAIEDWHTRFETLASRADHSSNLTVLNLRLWYMCARLLIDTESYGPEMRYDAFMHCFEAIINYGEQIAAHVADQHSQRSFSFDMGYMIPVYLTATRCRDPNLRRRAVRLLHDHPRQEGVWESVAAAAVAARWISVEEEGLGEVKSAADVPERKRIKYIDSQIDIDHRAASVRLTCSHRTSSREVAIDWTQERTDTVLLGVQDLIEPICAFESPLPDFEVRRASSSGISGITGIECFSDTGSSSSFSPTPKLEVMT